MSHMKKEEVELEKVWKDRCLFSNHDLQYQLSKEIPHAVSEILNASSNLSLISSVSQLLMGLGTRWSVLH